MEKVNPIRERASKEALKKYFYKNDFIPYETSFGKMKLSEAVNYMRIHLDGEWILDKIIKAQFKEEIKEQKFQRWEFYQSKTKLSWMLLASSANRKFLYSEEILFTNFSLRSIQLWKIPGNILIIPQEI